jgi:hypothetical protein
MDIIDLCHDLVDALTDPQTIPSEELIDDLDDEITAELKPEESEPVVTEQPEEEDDELGIDFEKFRDIVDVINEEVISRNYKIDPSGILFDCAEIIGIPIVKELKKLIKEGVHFTPNIDEINLLKDILVYMKKSFNLDITKMNKLSSDKLANEIIITKQLQELVPKHWFYEKPAITE